MYYDKFKKRFEQEATLRNLSERTRKSYWWHIDDYCRFLKKDPELSGAEDLRLYFQGMLSDGKHRPGSVKMGYYALRFLFTQLLHKEWASEYLPAPKTAKTLPLVLSQDEVFEVFSVIPNFKHRIILMFIYSTGARVPECVNIKIPDIDSRRIPDVSNGKVHFSWKDYRTGLFRKMNLDVDEFIRRFLLHVLPEGFFKVRYYGIFSSRQRKQNMQLAGKLLEEGALLKKEEAIEDGHRVWEKQDTVWDGILESIRNYKMPNCPVCRKGRMHFAGIVMDHRQGFG